MDWEKLIPPAITGLLSGALGSLIAPWVHWGIEKQKIITKNKEELIKEARQVLSDEELESHVFRNCTIYSKIRPYLTEGARTSVEGTFSGNGLASTETIQLVSGSSRHSGVNPFRNEVLDEITQLEKRWGLI